MHSELFVLIFNQELRFLEFPAGASDDAEKQGI